MSPIGDPTSVSDHEPMVAVIGVNPVILGTVRVKFSRNSNVDTQHVTLTVLFKADDNYHIWRLSAAIGGSL
jgi:hypothetical protein